MRNLIIFCLLLGVVTASAQAPALSDTTLVKFSAGNVTWLAPLSAMKAYIGASKIIVEESTPLPNRDTIRFIGAGITASDANGTRTEVALDGDLNALAGLSTTGILVRTGTDAFTTRSLSTATSISGLTYAWSNADGVSGAPAFNVNIGLLPWKHFAEVATTANISLSGNQTIDGVTTTNNMRVLVKNQSTASANGVYTANTGAWSRASDLDLGSGELDAGAFVSVRRGTANANTVWQLTTAPPITVGTTAQTWEKVLPASGSGLDTVAVTARISGNGTSGNPLDIAQQGASAGQAMKWSGSAWSPATDANGIYSGNGVVPNETYARTRGSNVADHLFNLGYFPTAPTTSFNNRESGLFFDINAVGMINSDSANTAQAYIYNERDKIYVAAQNSGSSKTAYVLVENDRIKLVGDSVFMTSLSSKNDLTNVVGMNSATGALYDVDVSGWDRNASDDISGSGAANQVAVFSGSTALGGSNAFVYESNTLSMYPSARDTLLVFRYSAEPARNFGLVSFQDTFNSGATAYKFGALDRAARMYLSAFETYVETPLMQVGNPGIQYKGTTGDLWVNMNGDFYTGTLTGANGVANRNMHWYFKSGGVDNQLGNPMVFQHVYEGNDTTGNSFEFLARNTASGGITHPDSTLFRIGNWDRGSALSIRHNRNVGLRTNSPLYSLHINATDAMRVPTGTTAERPTSLQAGLVRFNTSVDVLEFYDGSDWQAAGGGGGGNTNLSYSGTSSPVTLNSSTGTDVDIIAGGGVILTADSDELTISTTAPQPAGTETLESSNFTATLRRINQVDCSAGAISVTPPSSPAINDRFAVVDARAASATNNITINFTTASQKLYGTIQNYIINANGGYAEFIYMGSSTGWVATKG